MKHPLLTLGLIAFIILMSVLISGCKKVYDRDDCFENGLMVQEGPKTFVWNISCTEGLCETRHYSFGPFRCVAYPERQ